MVRLAIMCGLPRSGKTTWAKRLEREGWVRICPDDIRLAVHGQPFVKEAESAVWAIARMRARRLLKGDHMVLIDATNLPRKSRNSWRKLAKEFGLILDIYLVETPLEVCLARNTGTGAVSEDVLRRMNETMSHHSVVVCRLANPRPVRGGREPFYNGKTRRRMTSFYTSVDCDAV